MDIEEHTIPLPLLVAAKWQFELAYHLNEDREYWYSINDWIKGVIDNDADHASRIWVDLKRRQKTDFAITLKMLPYRAKDNKTYRREFTNEEGTLKILIGLRPQNKRIRLLEIRNYLSHKFPNLSFLYTAISPSASYGKTYNEKYLQNKLISSLQDFRVSTQIQTYKKLPSGRVIDIEAFDTRGNYVRLIECKLDLTARTTFYEAIGQILLYKAEYEYVHHLEVIPAIAGIKPDNSSELLNSCNFLGIELWELDIYDSERLYINGMDLATGKKMLT